MILTLCLPAKNVHFVPRDQIDPSHDSYFAVVFIVLF